ncbi:phosphonate C-P lyase system protein PhnH [Ancylobacter pratisalsi]|uniref:Phosphonate C-P lyase system protein PhnH n=1 Tax=Ancylobacter pratisalsi TaxID=1745854 RepID=A0A6P1YJF9_9HYPH|nr:phosphonate C-P lyase system protein PhnH [Ancylobacter pratisalsi]QIB32811.1 phosphonate C-P lyase system protein PhnH [Ancylobacter pratisalsi]
MSDQLLALGFRDPVSEAQATFRAAMWALARPGRLSSLSADITPPAPLNREAAALALALCDFETPLWLDAPLAEEPAVAEFLRFHTGAPIVDAPADARFAIVARPTELIDFDMFCQGSPDFPDESTTLILQVDGFQDTSSHGPGFQLEGPGIEGCASFGAHPLPGDFAGRMTRNRALFPRGLDLLLAGAGHVAGLPRSVSVREG